tara:strand:- start:45 stop:278 length:234 start_codon:yes stop_codon:yes gene_type:complete
MRNILIELPEEITASIRTKAHDEVADVGEALKAMPLDEIIKTMKDHLYQEKCRHKSALYFKDQEIKKLTTIIQDRAR